MWLYHEQRTLREYQQTAIEQTKKVKLLHLLQDIENLSQEMLAKALVISILVLAAASAVTRVLAGSELEAQLEKLNQDQAELNNRFKRALNEKYELVQHETDEYIANNSNGKFVNLLSATSLKQVSVLFAELETKKYAAVRRAIDISRNITKAKLGQKITTVEGEFTIDGELLDLIVARVKAASLQDVYESSEFVWRYLRMWTNFDEGRVFGARTKALFDHLEAIKLEENDNSLEKSKQILADYCARHEIKLNSALTVALNNLIKEFSEAYDSTQQAPGKNVSSLIKKYVGEQLLKSIKDNEEQCIKYGKAIFPVSVPSVTNVDKSDSYYYN